VPIGVIRGSILPWDMSVTGCLARRRFCYVVAV